MSKQETHKAYLEALITAARIFREGGTADIALPDPETGEITTLRVDQDSARDLILGYLGIVTSKLLSHMDSGQELPQADREALAVWLSTYGPSKDQIN